MDNATVRLDLDNEPQPDASLFIDPARGGQARISQDDYLEGAPELVAEVASSMPATTCTSSSTSIVAAAFASISFGGCSTGISTGSCSARAYEAMAAGSDDILKSTVFPGLWLDPSALLKGDLATF